MKIINNTIWNSADLRAILQRAAEQELEPAKRAKIVVTVDYTRTGRSSGCAYIGGRHATVRIQHPFTTKRQHVVTPLDPPIRLIEFLADRNHASYYEIKDDFVTAVGAWVRGRGELTPERVSDLAIRFAKVAAHEFAHLRGMEHRQMPDYYRWSGKWRERYGWALTMPLTVKADVKPDQLSKVESKLDNARNLLRAAETRAKRAATILKKWQRRVRTLESRQAALKGGQS